MTSASASGKRTEVVGKAAAATAPAATAVVPAQMGPQRGDTTGATMVVDDVWVQVGTDEVVASLSMCSTALTILSSPYVTHE